MTRLAAGFALLLALMLVTTAAALGNPLDLLGGYDPGSPGFNAMAVGLDGIAYLGSWGGGANCPSLGVRVVDVHDPTAPALIATAATYPGTTAEHVAGVRYATSAFSGSVLFAGIQRCAPSSGAPSGLAIWDVSDPRHAAELGFLPTGHGSRGVHE